MWRLLPGLGASGIVALHTLACLAPPHTTAVTALLTLTPATIMACARLTDGSRPGAIEWTGCLVSPAGAVIRIPGPTCQSCKHSA